MKLGYFIALALLSAPALASNPLLPDLSTDCTLQQSAVQSLSIKGQGLAFNGTRFGDVGTYTYLLAEANATVSANDPCAKSIVDLANAADEHGQVAYRFDVVILTPTDPAKANGTLLYEVVNRGRAIAMAVLQDGGANDLYNAVRPSVSADKVVTGQGAGNGFVLNQGTTLVWSGWQGDRPQSLHGETAQISAAQPWPMLGMSLPVARDRAHGNRTLEAFVQDEFIANDATSQLLGTYHKRAADTSARLTLQRTPQSPALTVPEKFWRYTAGSAEAEGGNVTGKGYGFVTIDRAAVRADASLLAGLDAGSDNGSIYHFSYTAQEPKVMGLGFLATRDLISFLRYAKADSLGQPNPLAGRVQTTLGTGISQSGRYLRDFLWQGFNTDAQGRRVFDGMLPLVAGSRKTYTNYRWAKPGDFSLQQENHYTPGDQFPFSYATSTDPLTGRTDGLLKRCLAQATCPKVIQYDSPVEAYGARASLLVTDGAGHDLAIPEEVRLFYVPGTTHTPMSLSRAAETQPDFSVDLTPPATAISASPGANVSSSALYRALLVNLEGWVKQQRTPLASQYPTLSDGTLALASAQPASLGMPDLAALGLGFSGSYNHLSVNDEGVLPTQPSQRFYQVYLPTTDGQGNERGGVKMPDVAVPLATFAGYSLRRRGFAEGQQNGLNSSQLAFALTPATRAAADPRQSVLELYGSRAGYVKAVDQAVDGLVDQQLLLDGTVGGVNDAADYKARARLQSQQAHFSQLP
ncbi:alpha/beta hydrolase domain-containing protein [Pseudomonas sp. nanlin1]|uniref:alpha/beta hydrolase domain-containing protein n=1 Tax=Pseudomonas sp. nanlin1 TaxID=3040605 RepID=UPI00388F77F2